MVFRFLILSDEVDDFKREIKIDSEATFLDLYNAIMDSVGYTKDQMSFDEMDAKTGNTEIGEDFYGDSEYDIDELDKEGFDGLGDGPMDNPYDDERF